MPLKSATPTRWVVNERPSPWQRKPKFLPGVQRLLEAAHVRRGERLLAREQLADGFFVVLFLVAATALALLAPADRTLEPLLALALVAAYVLVADAEFPSGAGFAVPTQIVFVPMLLLLPTPSVPLMVALAVLLRSTIDTAAGAARAHPRLRRGRLVRARAGPGPDRRLGADAGLGRLGDLRRGDGGPVVFYTLISAARAWSCLGVPPREILVEMRMANRVDLLLSPVGLLAAFGAAGQPYAVLLLLPLVPLFMLFAQERTARVEQTLELSAAYRGTALLLGDVIEADDAYTGQHTQDVVELTVAVADRLRVDDETPPGGRVRRAPARRRQGRDPERDHQQARPAGRRRVGDHEDPHRRGPADARAHRRPARPCRPRRPRLA